VTAAIRVDGVSVRLGRTEALHDVTLTVERGEWVALLGANGAGKTTLLRAVAGLVPFTGSIGVEDVQVGRARHRDVARRLAMVPQIPHTPPGMTVSEYVLLGRTPHIGTFASETKADRDAAERALRRLALARYATRRLGSLSGGELQRVVLARALAQEAPVLLLDEPTSALDLGRQQEALELVETLRREAELTVLCAMHDLTLAGQYADRLALLDLGRLVATGRPEELLSEEVISSFYGAHVEVIHRDGGVFVLPRRAARP
jgi:iron complex transport system ATP-binding protein